jgi:hypothetical protein
MIRAGYSTFAVLACSYNHLAILIIDRRTLWADESNFGNGECCAKGFQGKRADCIADGKKHVPGVEEMTATQTVRIYEPTCHKLNVDIMEKSHTV